MMSPEICNLNQQWLPEQPVSQIHPGEAGEEKTAKNVKAHPEDGRGQDNGTGSCHRP